MLFVLPLFSIHMSSLYSLSVVTQLLDIMFIVLGIAYIFQYHVLFTFLNIYSGQSSFLLNALLLYMFLYRLLLHTVIELLTFWQLNAVFLQETMHSIVIVVVALLFLVGIFSLTISIMIYNFFFLNFLLGCPFCYISFCNGNCFETVRKRPKILSFVFP